MLIVVVAPPLVIVVAPLFVVVVAHLTNGVTIEAEGVVEAVDDIEEATDDTVASKEIVRHLTLLSLSSWVVEDVEADDVEVAARVDPTEAAPTIVREEDEVGTYKYCQIKSFSISLIMSFLIEDFLEEECFGCNFQAFFDVKKLKFFLDVVQNFS